MIVNADKAFLPNRQHFVFLKACFSTYGSFLLIGRHCKYILNLHHCCYGNNLFGAAKVSWLQEHLGKHGAERKLSHPHTRGISQTAVMVQTCQQTCKWLKSASFARTPQLVEDFWTSALLRDITAPYTTSVLFLTSESIEQLQSLNHGLSWRRLLNYNQWKELSKCNNYNIYSKRRNEVRTFNRMAAFILLFLYVLFPRGRGHSH